MDGPFFRPLPDRSGVRSEGARREGGGPGAGNGPPANQEVLCLQTIARIPSDPNVILEGEHGAEPAPGRSRRRNVGGAGGVL